MLTDTWFSSKTKLFDFDEDTYKAIVPINFFDDISMNGHFGVEFKIKNNKATVVITALEDNPGVDVSIVINLVCMSIHENFIKHFDISPENIFWVINRPTSKQEINLATVLFESFVPVIINSSELVTFYNPKWTEINSLKKFIA
ncbi:MAG: hypothetical protein H7263_19070, partial [Candidatus Sericytochromatia bacterium]|nr:hypothetical protein [Candidatus Sericytochromatia bacterium]